MRLHGRWAPLAAGLLALGVAGCGSSAPTTQPTVNVTITAPTSGVTVGVHRVLVVGTVTPANAQVMVGGQPAQVSKGRFTRPLYLAAPSQVVTVTAQAQGYIAAHAATTIHYSANLAAQLVASASTLNAQDAVPVSSTPAAKASPAAVSALHQALALPSSAGSPAIGSGSGSAAKHKTSKSTTPTHTTPTRTTPTRTTPTTTTPTPSPPSSSGGGSTQPVTRPPVMTVARIKQDWKTGCLTHVKGENVVPYCTCLYNHLSATGTFKTPTTVNGLLKKLHDYSKTGDRTTLPRAVQLALTVCAVKLPALMPTGNQPTLVPLPGLSHRRVPFPVIVKLRPKTAR
jgi:hypothetical protein